MFSKPKLKENSTPEAKIIINTYKKLKKAEIVSRTADKVLTGVFYTSFFSLAIAVLMEMRILDNEVLFLIPLILISTIFVITGIEVLKPVQPELLLLTADKKYELKERLITAYDIISKDENTSFSELILKDAAKYADKVNPRYIYPFKTSKKVGIIPLLIMFIVLLLTFDIYSFFSRTYDAGVQLEKYAEILAARADENNSNENTDLFREMEELGKQMQRSLSESDSLQDKIDKLRDEVKQQIAGLERTGIPDATMEPFKSEIEEEFGEDIGRLKNGEMSDSEIQDLQSRISDSGKLTEGQKDSAEKAFDNYDPLNDDNNQGELANSLAKSFSSGEKEQEDLKDFQEIGEILGNMSSSNTADGEPSDSNTENRAGSTDQRTNSGENDSAEDKSDQSGSDGSSEDGVASNTPGKTAEEDQFETPGEQSTENDGQSSSIEGSSINMNNLEMLIRDLPKPNESFISEKEIILEYSKKIEEVIEKEEIPLGMRTYIKDYFLRIGTFE